MVKVSGSNNLNDLSAIFCLKYQIRHQKTMLAQNLHKIRNNTMERRTLVMQRFSRLTDTFFYDVELNTSGRNGVDCQEFVLKINPDFFGMSSLRRTNLQ